MTDQAEQIEFAATTVGTLDIKQATSEALLKQIASSAEVPRKFKRIAARSTRWDIPRSFVGYRADPTIQTVGAAPKWVLKSADGGPDYIIKLPLYKWGLQETLSELLINQLGAAFKFDIAHSGLAAIDGKPVFVTRSFLGPTEHLVHGSFLIEEIYQAPHGELDTVPKGRKEQEFYSVDFVLKTLEEYCGNTSKEVLSKFTEMLLFDALIGATDRHAQNWGVIRSSTTQGGYRFAPIFDTSRGLLWNLTDAKLPPLLQDDGLLRNHILRAYPVMGPQREALATGKRCDHFELLTNLFAIFPHLKATVVTKVPCNIEKATVTILNSFPFRGAFSRTRRDTILRLILRRAEMVSQVLVKP